MKFALKNHKFKQVFFTITLVFVLQGLKSQTLSFSITSNPQCYAPFPNNSVNAFIVSSPTTATSYTWNVSSPSGSCNASYTINPPNGASVTVQYPCCGNYTINCVALNGTATVGAATTIFTVSCPSPVSITGSSSLCAGNSSTLTALGAQSYTWNNAVSSSVNVVSPTVSTTYSVLGINSSGCTSSASVNVNVIQPVQANFTYSTLTNGQIVFNNTSTNTTTNTSYFWDFGNGITSSSVSPSVTYTSNGVYTVSLTANSINCGSSVTSQTITVSSAPSSTCIPSFTYVAAANGTFTFTSTSPSASSLTSYSWDFGNGSPPFVSTGSSGVVPPPQTYTATTFTVSLKITNANPFCTDSVSQVILACNLQPDFNSVLTSSNIVHFISASSGTIPSSTYLWNFGDGSNGSGSNPSHTYSSSGTYSVTLTVGNTSTCTSTITKTIVIHDCTIFSNFTHTALTNGVVNFSSNSSITTGLTKYYWDFGDGIYSLASSPTHTYTNAGTFYVKLKIQDTLSTCTDSVIQSINITGVSCVASANFSITPSNTPQYWIATPSYPYNITSATWYWGDGNQSNSLYASHLYTVASNYSICLSVTVSCGSNSYYCHSYYLNKTSDPSSQIISINVEPPPITNSILETSLEDLSFLIYPNPNNGEFDIVLNRTNKDVHISVFNLLGDMVHSQNIKHGESIETVRLNNVPNGIYLIKLSYGSQTITQKIVISQ